MNEKEIIRTFQVRRTRLKRFLKAFVTLFISGLVVAVFGPTFFHFEGIVPFGFGVCLVSALFFVLYTHFTYRCPNCDGPVESENGVQSDPTHCPKCGVRLKSDLLAEYESIHTVGRSIRLFLPVLIGWLMVLVPCIMLVLNGLVVMIGTPADAEIVQVEGSGGVERLSVRVLDPVTHGEVRDVISGVGGVMSGERYRGEHMPVYLVGEAVYPALPVYLLFVPLGIMTFGVVWLFAYSRWRRAKKGSYI